jgi:hypothetical protein
MMNAATRRDSDERGLGTKLWIRRRGGAVENGHRFSFLALVQTVFCVLVEGGRGGGLPDAERNEKLAID